MTRHFTAAEITRQIHAGEITARQVVEQALDRIERGNPTLNAFRETYAESSLAAAADIDDRRQRHEILGPLAGVPVALKDNIVSRHGTTAAGSRMLEHFASPYDATVVQRLRDADAIIIGRTNCDEFAMGSSGEHCAFGPAANPWDTSRVPGGSSSGSAIAVAAGFVPIAIGSDTGGSIRQPASFCGLIGFKPTYGRVSRSGLIAYGSSLDQIGPFARNLDDAAAVYNVIAGHDPLDATTADFDVEDPRPGALEPGGAADLRIGVSPAHRTDGNDPDVNAAIDKALDTLRRGGATIVEIELPPPEVSVATYYLIATAEASSNLARYDGIRYGHRARVKAEESLETLYSRSRSEGFGAEVKLRILLGTFVLSAGYADQYYTVALKARRWIADAYARAFTRCDVILGPTTPTPAFPLGDKPDPLSMYLCDVYTVDANIAGLCAMSLPGEFVGEPVGKKDDRLPVGVHLCGRPFAESMLFRAAGCLAGTASCEIAPDFR